MSGLGAREREARAPAGDASAHTLGPPQGKGWRSVCCSAASGWAGNVQQHSAAPVHFRLTALWCLCAAMVAVAGADEASEDEVEASGEESGEIGASDHAKTVTLFPDFPDKSACPTPPCLPLP